MSGWSKLSDKSRLFILEISTLYGGLLSFIFIFAYLILLAFLPGTLKYFLIQAILLLFGVVLTTIFSVLNIEHEKTSGIVACSIFTGLIISILCIAPGLILTICLMLIIFQESIFNLTIMVFFIIGSTALVLGTLSMHIVLNSKRSLSVELKQWKIKGLQISIAMLVIGLVIAGVSIQAGPITNSSMTYEVWLNTSENTTFLIPIPVNNSKDNIGDSITGLTIKEGNADWKIADTEYGKALEVHTQDKCKLFAKKNYGSMSWDEADEWLESYKLSTLKEVNRTDVYEIWIFASTNSTVSIRLILNDGWNNELWYNAVSPTHNNTLTYEIPLEEGWQVVNLKQNMVFYD